MRRSVAALGTAAFFAAAPGVVAGLGPWWLTNGWTASSAGTSVARELRLAVGASTVVLATTVLVATFVRYVVDGLGTPAPVAPTERLVVRGVNRYVRNPMYAAVVAAIAGQALLLGRVVLVAYAAVAFAAMAAFARWYEEPVLAERFGPQYESYRRSVPAWLPRLRIGAARARERPWRRGQRLR
jgi:protein-S-isoprenylcysteine O-methyltransferase Ste14